MALYSRKKAPDWSANEDPALEAKCRQFPTPHSLTSDPWFDDPDEARAVCNGDVDGIICPMRQQCLVQAMVNCERHGVWAGLSEEQLAWMRKRYRRKPEMWLVDNAPTHQEALTDAAACEGSQDSTQEAAGPSQPE
ncbi:WhiB family transcriptional regulator [Streptomyces sp. WZ-12]|uniref:WhiB family transcriptional regulator n=1 Tax=Streptomyces sp. WZ-12 TaxID=3030210 RepID=UPI00238167F1|nr:WhiB family transcriptional regulator [Streptomyces sp. WZ-12]